MRGFALAALLSLVAGCALRAPALPASAAGDDEAFAVSGRFAVRYGTDGGSGQLAWQHTRGGDVVSIRNPIGSTLAEIRRADGVYELDTPDRPTERARDPDDLTERALGWRLPLRGMPWWLRGLAAPDLPLDAPETGATADPALLRQAGWTIQYLSRHARNGLPERLTLTRGDLQIRLILDDWGGA